MPATRRRSPPPAATASRSPACPASEPVLSATGSSTTRPADFILTGAGELLTLDPDLDRGPLGIIRGGALAAHAGKIIWVGKTAKIRKNVWLLKDGRELDAHGRVVMPGFVDSHTHLIFAGSREQEFARRIAGASYQEIAAAGGGILSTVQATREAATDELAAV